MLGLVFTRRKILKCTRKLLSVIYALQKFCCLMTGLARRILRDSYQDLKPSSLPVDSLNKCCKRLISKMCEIPHFSCDKAVS